MPGEILSNFISNFLGTVHNAVASLLDYKKNENINSCAYDYIKAILNIDRYCVRHLFRVAFYCPNYDSKKGIEGNCTIILLYSSFLGVEWAMQN